jgi:ribosomal protein S18 acetylase RimI-like enzyme
VIELRWSRETDSPALAALHGEAWRYAYAGIIPGLVIERMVARRGPRWWSRLHGGGGSALVVELDGAVAGYATLGPNRAQGRLGRRPRGEIYELYLRPEYQGVGLGRRLFDAARERLAGTGLAGTVVWSLADNAIGCRFYRAMGGAELGRGRERIGGVALDKLGFVWG